MTTQAMNRRNFIRKIGATGAAMVTAPYIIPASAFGANERIVMGIMGPGGRGRSVMREFIANGAVFGAVCDVFKPNRDEGVKLAKTKNDNSVAEYEDWRDLLDKSKDLDAILIATPEHQHGVQLISTVKAGLDSYCEKPMSHSIEEGNRMVKEVNKTKQIVQIGMQRRSTPFVRASKQHMNKLGKVYFVRVKWNWAHRNNGFFNVNNAPLDGGDFTKDQWKLFCQPSGRVKYEPKKFRHWRWFWAFSGGNITDQGTHLMDVVQWFMSDEFNPVTPEYAECFGEVYNLKNKETGVPLVETPDVFTSIYHYPGFLVNWSLNYTTSYQNAWSIEFMGDAATMVLDDKGMRIYEETWDPADDSMQVSKKPPVVQEKGGLESISHVKNFLDCMKSRQKPNAPVEIGHKAVCGPHLANVAYHRKERAYLNPTATKVNRDWL